MRVAADRSVAYGTSLGDAGGTSDRGRPWTPGEEGGRAGKRGGEVSVDSGARESPNQESARHEIRRGRGNGHAQGWESPLSPAAIRSSSCLATSLNGTRWARRVRPDAVPTEAVAEGNGRRRLERRAAGVMVSEVRDERDEYPPVVEMGDLKS